MDLTYLKLVFLLASLAGYILFIQKRGIEIAFAPALTVAGIGLAMFLAGLLGWMPQTAFTIFVFGLLLFCFALLTRFRLDPHSTALLTFFSLFILVLSVLYRNTVFTMHDDFSHWALVVKNMLLEDRMPNADSILYFHNYPTGTAGFLYFACKILGHSEANMLRGQTILIISSLCPLWAWVKRRHSFCGGLITIVSLYLMLTTGTIRTLLVDIPLALFAAASFLLLLYYRDDAKKASLCSCLVLSYLVLVKNSTLFFVILHLLPALYFVQNTHSQASWTARLRAFGRILVFQLLIPLAFYLLWDWHVEHTFEAGNMTQHSLSVPYLLKTFSEKNFQEIRSIFIAFAFRSIKVGFEIPAFLVVLAVWTMGCVVHYRKDKHTHPAQLGYLFWGVIAFGAWMLGLLGMYMFSMPYAEAIILGSYSRYVTTIAIYLVYICFTHLMDQISSVESLVSPAAIVSPLMVCILLFSVRGNLPSLLVNTSYQSQARDTLTELRQKYQIPDHSNYFIVCDGWDVYTRFVARYDFWSSGVFVASDPLNPVDSYWREVCDHLILLREGEDVDQFLEEQGLPAGEQYYYLPNYR